MKTHKIALILCCSLFTFHSSLSQNITADTISANNFLNSAWQLLENYELDSALLFAGKAQILFVKHLGENSMKNAEVLRLLGNLYYVGGVFDESLNYFYKSIKIRLELQGEDNRLVERLYFNIGFVYQTKGVLDSAMVNHLKALNIRLRLYGENNSDVAQSYNNIGNLYREKSEFENAFAYHDKALNIRLSLFGENSPDVAESYLNIASIYADMEFFDTALEYNFKSLDIFFGLFGEKHPAVAGIYNNIADIFNNKNEYDKALEYHQKALNLRLELFGENHPDVIASLNNIGVVYGSKLDHENALDFLNKGLKKQLELFGENNSITATSYLNIGNEYRQKKEYDMVLGNLEKGLKILLELTGERNPYVAMFYNNIGSYYNEKFDYDNALVNHFKSLDIRLGIFGEKNTDVAMSYINIGLVYEQLKEYDVSLKFNQKTIAACLWNYNDTSNVHSIPSLENYLNWFYLLEGLYAKARIYADTSVAIQHISVQDRLNYALLHFKSCDALITLVRKEITSQSDKLSLGEKADLIYKKSADLCEQMKSEYPRMNENKNYSELSFYFSERNKSSVLLEALSGSEALNFSGIPDSFIRKEQTISYNITNFINLKNNAANDSIASVWSNRLFDANRSYDSLIYLLETNYPEYYQLKYNNKPVTVQQIQSILDKKTAMLSYFVVDSSVIIYAITKKHFETYKISKLEDFDNKMIEFRSVMQSSTPEAVGQYKTLAFELYNQLFPKVLFDKNALSGIENLIIIPDGNLASLPFESLLTEKYTAGWTDWKNTAYFSEMPFLIKKYAISYSYSASLFYNTFPKTKSDQVEFSNLNDWLAFAPVFDNNGTAGTNAVTRELLSEIKRNNFNCSDQTRSFLRDGTYISPLPGSLDEVNEILQLYDQKGKKAKIYTHKKADESILKTNELRNYRILHFATHGFVNTDKPELSGILTAQDTSMTINDYEDIYGYIAQQNDGIWYQSEIYNTKLNADLLVLSACETGLGKIASGEGVIGLTRALLYAGTKNIIVSLWQVSDESTKELMVGFYKNLLNQKSKRKAGYSDHLQKAKLKLIKEGTYAHPFFWSPFILIGK
jgi:CHAT domain-containing protein